MILIDFSALAYQAIHSAVSTVKPRLDGEKFITSDFSPYMVYRILESVFDMQERFNDNNVVLCLDGESSKNWRKVIYPMYKSSRPKERKQSNINFNEVFEIINSLIDTLKTSSPYKVVRVPEAEGDDVIMVLAKELPGNKTIVSSDKDLIQMQQYPGIQQFSYLTQKFVTHEDKHEDTMQDWLLEHVVLGDATDDVPRIVDGLKFSPAFEKFIYENNLALTEAQVRNTNWEQYGFNEYRDGAMMMLDVFERPRFGITNARKLISQYGSLDAWLDSDPNLRENYNRNRALVLEEGIPDSVRRDVIIEYRNASDTVDFDAFEKFLNDNQIQHLSLSLPSNFRKPFTVEDLF